MSSGWFFLVRVIATMRCAQPQGRNPVDCSRFIKLGPVDGGLTSMSSEALTSNIKQTEKKKKPNLKKSFVVAHFVWISSCNSSHIFHNVGLQPRAESGISSPQFEVEISPSDMMQLVLTKYMCCFGFNISFRLDCCGARTCSRSSGLPTI